MMMVCLWTNCLNVCDPNGQISQEHQKKKKLQNTGTEMMKFDRFTHTHTLTL